MFVLACTMAQRGGDERFYLPARQAAGRFAALQKQMGGHTDVYAVDNHSCVINAAMEQLAKPERSVERKAVKRTRRSGKSVFEIRQIDKTAFISESGCISEIRLHWSGVR